MNMKKLIIAMAMAPFILYSCGIKDENEQLKLQNEELSAELNRAQVGVSTLEQIGVLMDSIDQMRNVIQLDLEAGTSYEDYLEQMEALTQYVSDTEAKLSNLEGQFSETSEKNKAYISTISRLKKDLSVKAKEIEDLRNMVDTYKIENDQLLSMVEIQEAELTDKSLEIERKREELALLENKMVELMTNSQISEADSYYARASAIEEAANRTKLAPKKRKETYTEALELYKKALALGSDQAEQKIKDLEKKI